VNAVSRNKLLIPILGLVVAAGAFWFLALAPKREEIVKLDSEIAVKKSEVDQSKQLVAEYEKAKANYRANYAKLASLGKAVPADDDVRSLIVQIDDAARRSGVDFRALNITGSGAAGGESAAPATAATTTPGTAAPPPPGTVPIGSAGFSAMPFSLSFQGSYFNLSQFFRRLERFVTVQNNNIDVTGRLLLLGNISVTPQAGENGKKRGNLAAEVGAATYLVPPNETVGGAATPAPAGTAPAPAGTTTPTTTATITGTP
jgi:Tfp pilus assembly protein PilO